jgi:hypothetical protein
MILYRSDKCAHYTQASRTPHNTVGVLGHALNHYHFHAFLAVLAAQRLSGPVDLLLLVH